MSKDRNGFTPIGEIVKNAGGVLGERGGLRLRNQMQRFFNANPWVVYYVSMRP